MGGLTDAIEDRVLCNVTDGCYLGLLSVSPDASGAGYIEVDGANYQRIPAAFELPHRGSIKLAWEADFPIAESRWGKIRSVGIFDSPQRGNLLAWAEMEAPIIINKGETLRFPPGSIEISMN